MTNDSEDFVDDVDDVDDGVHPPPSKKPKQNKSNNNNNNADGSTTDKLASREKKYVDGDSDGDEQHNDIEMKLNNHDQIVCILLSLFSI